MAWAPAAINAAATIGSALLSRNRGTPKSGIDKRKTKLIDDLLQSLKGQGSFSNLFNASDEDFQKSFVNPAKQMFNSQIAPQIQQSYIASGQQRGTGLDDTLQRAGVDLDQMLNQQYYNYKQDAMNRQQDVIGRILGTSMSSGQPGQSASNAAMQAGGGFISQYQQNNDIGQQLLDFLKNFQGNQNGISGSMGTEFGQRRGFS